MFSNVLKSTGLLFYLILSSISYASASSLLDGIYNNVTSLLEKNNIKPYIIPLQQGKYLNKTKLEQISPGLSKEQVEYLIGSPTTQSPFDENKWTYLYYDNLENKVIKNISIVFKNEKIFEVLSNGKIIKALNKENIDIAVDNLPLEKNYENKENEISVIKLSLDNSVVQLQDIDVCKLNDYEIFADLKTLEFADESTLEIRADNQTQEENIFTATGKAEAERQNDILRSDNITYNTLTKNLDADGSVSYFNEDLTVYSKQAKYDSNNSKVSFYDAKYFLAKKDGVGRSKEITMFKNKDVKLIDGSYTACSIDDPDWNLTSTSTYLYEDSERGHSYNMILKYKNLPIFYTPFISYPLTDKRQSGILTPSFGSAGDSGSSFSVPYYFNLSDNYDATVEITNLSDRGILFDNEVRHLGVNSNTLINFTSLENDDEFGEDRYLYSLRDTRTLISDTTQYGFSLSSNIFYNRVSDVDYFDDFGDSLSITSQSNVTRDIRLFGQNYTNNGLVNFDFSSISYQPAQTGISEQYQTVPSLKINYEDTRSTSGYYLKLKSSIDKFKHKDGTKAEGTRYLFYPSIEYPMRSDSWELLPKFGMRYIDYDVDNSSTNTKSKVTPITSLRGKVYLEKNMGDKLYTLEPELYFLYIPVGNQDNNPIFDTGLKEFKYYLFSENKFYGEDRLNDAKQVTMAITHRIFDDYSGDELFSGTLAQIIHFDDRDVHLTSNTKKHSDASNIIGLANARLDKNSSLSVGSVFNPHAGHGMRNVVRYRYDNSKGLTHRIMNIDYRFIRGSEEEIDLSGVYSFNRNFSIVGKYNYSFSNSRSNVEDLIDTMFGLEINSCCYALKIVARDYWTGTKKDNILYVEFLPKGLTTTNNKTASVLRRGIPGYKDNFEYE